MSFKEAIEDVGDFLSIVLKLHESGQTTYVLLWVVILALFWAVIWSQRQNKKLQRNYEKYFTEELEKCHSRCEEVDKRQEESDLRYLRLKNKYTMVVGMLVVYLGKRQLPQNFWEIVLDDNISTIPDISNFSEIKSP